ncbi:cytoskeleton-associated protein 2-like [Erpetoichthys calabaricus]|uniref:cytoskeleton-associated protein 2-like n=1 Tax=Erpetoichthys calabaricus TaxID=27687 RepID=UPI002233E67C|nr:cytoskeleton-associated protein 2-like [Erpetoichthys calabaricus]
MDEKTKDPARTVQELRKQKLLEYLANKGKLKPPNPKPYLRDIPNTKKALPKSSCQTFARVASKGKENSCPAVSKSIVNKNKIGDLENCSIYAVSNDDRKPWNSSTLISRPSVKTSVSFKPLPSSSAAKPPSQSACVPLENLRVSGASRQHLSAKGLIPNHRPSSATLQPSTRTQLLPSVRTAVKRAGEGVHVHNKTTAHQFAKDSGAFQPFGDLRATRLSSRVVGTKTSLTGRRPEEAKSNCKTDRQSSRTVAVQDQKSMIPLSIGHSRRSFQSQARIKSCDRISARKVTDRPTLGSQTVAFTDKKRPSSATSDMHFSRREPSELKNNVKTAEGNKKILSNKRSICKKENNHPVASNTTTTRPSSLPNLPSRQSQLSSNENSVNKLADGIHGFTAKEEERIRKLQEWQKAKGKSYKRPPMPTPVKKVEVKNELPTKQSFWATIEEEDAINSLVTSIDRMLSDCLELIHKGCPSEEVLDIMARMPVAKKFARYWMCKAWLMERDGNYDVLPLFEEAVRDVAEPVEELRAVIFEIMKKKEDNKVALNSVPEEPTTPLHLSSSEPVPVENDSSKATEYEPKTPKSLSVLLRTEKNGSSVVKYKVTSTAGGAEKCHKTPVHFRGQELKFLTPVRRSVRIEKRSYPHALEEHDLCVASYQELMAAEDMDDAKYVYRQNDALQDQIQMKFVLLNSGSSSFDEHRVFAL